MATNVFDDDGELIGYVDRDDWFGVISWVAFDNDERRLGTFRGRGAKQRAIAAVRSSMVKA